LSVGPSGEGGPQQERRHPKGSGFHRLAPSRRRTDRAVAEALPRPVDGGRDPGSTGDTACHLIRAAAPRDPSC
jgi:hypothetical protein